MADSSDFMALYDELGLTADCSLQQLTTVWRRRVSQLHPDRAGNDPDAAATLQLLNARYRKARLFHHQHGRLPGSPMRSTTTAIHTASPRSDAHPGQRRGILWLLTLLVLVLLWSWSRTLALPHDNAPRPATHVASGHAMGQP